MITFECTVQEGDVPEEIRPHLAAELARISTSILGGSPDDVDVEFIEIPRGYGFSGGELASRSAVKGLIPDGCEQETRHRLLREISDRWCEITGCSTDDLVVSAHDRSHQG